MLSLSNRRSQTRAPRPARNDRRHFGGTAEPVTCSRVLIAMRPQTRVGKLAEPVLV